MRTTLQLFGRILMILVSSYSLNVFAQNTVSKIEFSDFIVDFDLLHGKSVQLDGWLITMGDTFMLYERAGSMTAIYADSSRLSSDEKRFLISRCGSGCNVSLIGKPSMVMFNKGIALSRIASPQIAATNNKTGKVNSSNANIIPQMNVPDFIVDYDSLIGKQVQLQGYLLSMGESLILYEQMGSLNAIFIDGSRLSRDERKYILNQCSGGCSIILAGKPGAVMMNKGLVATRIIK